MLWKKTLKGGGKWGSGEVGEKRKAEGSRLLSSDMPSAFKNYKTNEPWSENQERPRSSRRLDSLEKLCFLSGKAPLRTSRLYSATASLMVGASLQ